MFRCVVLDWKRFTSFMQAQDALRGRVPFEGRDVLLSRPCIYLLADESGQEILRIGQTQDLWQEYSGGRRYMVEAAMSGSGKCVFLAEAPWDERERVEVERTLIWAYKPRFNDRVVSPTRDINVEHRGDVPARFRSG